MKKIIEELWDDHTIIRKKQVTLLIKLMNEKRVFAVVDLFSELSSFFDLLSDEQMSDYRTLKMYRHWLFHGEVSRSSHASRLLSSIGTEALELRIQEKDEQSLNIDKNFAKLFMANLLKELNRFLKEHNCGQLNVHDPFIRNTFLQNIFVRVAYKQLSHPDLNDPKEQDKIKSFKKLLKKAHESSKSDVFEWEQFKAESDKKTNPSFYQENPYAWYIFRWVKVVNVDGQLFFALKGYFQESDYNKYTGVSLLFPELLEEIRKDFDLKV